MDDLTRHEMERALDAQARLVAAEVLKAANDHSRESIVSAVESVVTSVTLQIGMSEKTTTAKIDGLKSNIKWMIAAGLVGGQSVAALLTAYMTGRPASVAKIADAAVGFFT